MIQGQQKHALLPLSALILTLILSGCIYKLDTRQGNFIEDVKVEQVQLGWTRDQVIYLLGSPMIKDPFHQAQWDYVYYFRSGDGKETERKRVTIYFTDDKVARVERHD